MTIKIAGKTTQKIFTASGPLTVAASMLSLMIGAHSALAQTAAPTQELTTLDEIIVTAQRREQNLQDVPLSVATVGGEKLDVLNSGTADIKALSARIPSLQIESSFGRTFPRFYIRGLGNTDFDLNASQPVSLVYDEVVLENPILKGFPVFDLERVEVLRGPQGTLFGRNTPAGIVKFDSKKPTQETNGYGSLSYGRFNAVKAEGAIGGGLIADKLAARVSLLYQRQDNWVDNTLTPQNGDLEGFDEFAGRLQILATPTEKLSVLLSGQVRSLDGTARVFRANILSTGSNQLNSNYNRFQVSQDGLNFQNLNTYNVSGTIKYDFGPVTLTSVTAYWNGNLRSRGDIDGGYGASFAPPSGPGFIPFWAQSQDDVPSLNQFTEEVRLSSNGSGPFTYQVGFFYFDEAIDIDSFSFPTPTSLVPDIAVHQRQDSIAWGLFGSATYAFTDKFSVTGGVRYNDDSRDFTAQRTVGGPQPLTVTREVGDSLVTWDVSATYKATDDVNLYARVASGYRAPSIQGRILFGDDVSTARSEKILSVEGGVKSKLFDNRVRFNLTGFYYTMDDQQLTAVGGGVNFNRLINAANTEGYGFEADLEAKVAENFLVTAGLSYNHTRLDDPNLETRVCGSPCTILDPTRVDPTILFGDPRIASLNGNSLPQAPRWIFNVTARYGVPVGNDGEVFAYTDWAYRSKINFFLYDSVEFSDDTLIEGGLRIGYLNKRHDYELAFFLRNITGNNSITTAVDFNNLTAGVNEPRIWGVEAKIRF